MWFSVVPLTVKFTLKKKKWLHIQEKDVEVHGDVVHADQGCHGIVLWPWDVDFSMP